MTVQQLIDRLRDFPPEMEVCALWDTMPDWPIHRIELYRGMVLIDCGDCDGDWDVVANDAGRPPTGSI